MHVRVFPKTMRVFTLFLLAGLSYLAGCNKDPEVPPVVPPDKLPQVITDDVYNISQTVALGGGRVYGDSIGTLTQTGLCWNTTGTPTISDAKSQEGSDTGTFGSGLWCLLPNTVYYVRAYATNSAGTAYGNTVSFMTDSKAILFQPSSTYGLVFDFDGNDYKTITIGFQTWMAENLRTTHFQNGDPIQQITDDIEWMNLPLPYRCTYGNSESNAEMYGRLYNFYAVDDSRNICPEGYHVPSKGEWEALVSHLGGFDEAAAKLMEVETIHWPCPNEKATNASGFTAIGAGLRNTAAEFGNLDLEAAWWSSSEVDTLPYAADLFGVINESVYTYSQGKKAGYSVRCVHD